VPEFLLGRGVRCPGCRQMFTAPAIDAPVAATAVEAEHDVPVVRVPSLAVPPQDDDYDDDLARPYTAAVPWVALIVSGFLLLGGVAAVAFFAMLSSQRQTFPVATMPVPPPPATPTVTVAPDGTPVGLAPEAITGGEAAPPEPRVTSEWLAGTDEDLPGLTVHVVGLPRDPNQRRFAPGAPGGVILGGPGGMPRNHEMCWAGDGKHFYVLSADNILYRISADGRKAVRSLDIAQPCEGLARCTAGLIVTLPDLEQVWLIDPVTLRVKVRKQLGGLHTAVTAPDLDFALALCGSRGVGTTRGVQAITRIDWPTEELTVLDVTNVPLYAGFGLQTPARSVLAPDGKALYGCNSDGRLAAFTVEPNKVILRESSGLTCSSDLVPLVLSPDGKHLAAPSSSGTNTTTAVVAATDLQTTLFEPNGRGQGRPAGFTSDSMRVFTHTVDSPLVEFDLTGKQVATHNIGPNRPAGTWGLAYAASPDGKLLLMQTTTELLLIEWK
ncbi:MAG: hypothetical protein U0746_06205, partial [Gemmataceae bacterium]